MTSARRAAAPRHNIVLTASALLAVIFAISPAAAQTPNDDFARRQAQEAEQQRLETLGRMTPKPAQTEAQQPAASGG
ncbi:ShlB/FhaC/HecB family hemolysin secretion/activation protein, partial [Rhizobium rhizogenes]